MGETTGFSETSPGATLSGKDITWSFTDLEPDEWDNLQISLVSASAWLQMLAEQKNVTTNPKDGEAWGRLGKAYKEMISLRRGLRQDPGGLELYSLSVAAYQKAVDLKPKDALWHLGFADLLWKHYYFHVYFTGSPDNTELVKALQELDASLHLAPTNSRSLDLAQEILSAIPGLIQGENGHFKFLLLTSTAIFTPHPTWPGTPTSTSLPVTLTFTPQPPTQTPTPVPSQAQLPIAQGDADIQPSARLTPTPSGKSSPRLPVCGISLLVPLGLLAFGRFLTPNSSGNHENRVS
jgi:hypothetical protein